MFRPNDIKRADQRDLIQSAIVLLKKKAPNDAIAYELGMFALDEHKANRISRRDALENASMLLTATVQDGTL